MHKVQGITASGLRRPRERDARHGRQFLPAPAPKGEAFVPIIHPLHFLMVHAPAFPSQSDIDPRAAIAPLALGDLPNPRPQNRIVLPSAAIPERIAIEGQKAARPSLTEPKALGAPLGRRSLRLGLYQFFALMAFSAWISSA
jgi:hypothetical protein